MSSQFQIDAGLRINFTDLYQHQLEFARVARNLTREELRSDLVRGRTVNRPYFNFSGLINTSFKDAGNTGGSQGSYSPVNIVPVSQNQEALTVNIYNRMSFAISNVDDVQIGRGISEGAYLNKCYYFMAKFLDAVTYSAALAASYTFDAGVWNNGKSNGTPNGVPLDVNNIIYGGSQAAISQGQALLNGIKSSFADQRLGDEMGLSTYQWHVPIIIAGYFVTLYGSYNADKSVDYAKEGMTDMMAGMATKYAGVMIYPTAGLTSTFKLNTGIAAGGLTAGTTGVISLTFAGVPFSITFGATAPSDATTFNTAFINTTAAVSAATVLSIINEFFNGLQRTDAAAPAVGAAAGRLYPVSNAGNGFTDNTNYFQRVTTLSQIACLTSTDAGDVNVIKFTVQGLGSPKAVVSDTVSAITTTITSAYAFSVFGVQGCIEMIMQETPSTPYRVALQQAVADNYIIEMFGAIGTFQEGRNMMMLVPVVA